VTRRVNGSVWGSHAASIYILHVVGTSGPYFEYPLYFLRIIHIYTIEYIHRPYKIYTHMIRKTYTHDIIIPVPSHYLISNVRTKDRSQAS
jgi:hypothetical protein